jgi:hypothetical protein
VCAFHAPQKTKYGFLMALVFHFIGQDPPASSQVKV